MKLAIVIIAIIAYLGFREWLRHNRRAMIHKERLVAIEKGIELPSLEQEARRSATNVQRVLLLAGLIWISLGIGAYATLAALLASPANVHLEIPPGIQWVGLAPVAIGLSHLVVYVVEKKRER
jgi:hypothetical protein